MVLDIEKKYSSKTKINRVELEYDDMNYIIVNFEKNVIDDNGSLREYSITDSDLANVEKLIWNYEEIDEYDYWPDKSKDHPPMATMWRIAWWDENGRYHHKSGATKYPDDFMTLVNELRKLK